MQEPGTAGARTSSFLSTIKPAFNAGDAQGDADSYAVFGHVTEGMDVVKAILDARVSSDQRKWRHEGPDARPAGQDHQGRAGERSPITPSSLWFTKAALNIC